MSTDKDSTLSKSTSKPMAKIRLKTTGLQFKCSAPGCDVNKAINISLHPFPSEATEPDRHQIWKRLLLIEHTVKRSDVICARHFPKASFKHNANGSTSIFLRPDAYPYATSKLKLRIERRLAEKAAANQAQSSEVQSRNSSAEIGPSQNVEIIEEDPLK